MRPFRKVCGFYSPYLIGRLDNCTKVQVYAYVFAILTLAWQLVFYSPWLYRVVFHIP